MRVLDELRQALRPVPVVLTEDELRQIWEHLYDTEEGSARARRVVGVPEGQHGRGGVSATRISRKDLSALMERRPELRFSISPLVDPSWPEGVTLYSWHVGGEQAQLHEAYSLSSVNLPRETVLVLVDAQIRMAGRRFDVASWELGRLARLRAVAA